MSSSTPKLQKLLSRAATVARLDPSGSPSSAVSSIGSPVPSPPTRLPTPPSRVKHGEIDSSLKDVVDGVSPNRSILRLGTMDSYILGRRTPLSDSRNPLFSGRWYLPLGLLYSDVSSCANKGRRYRICGQQRHRASSFVCHLHLALYSSS